MNKNVKTNILVFLIAYAIIGLPSFYFLFGHFMTPNIPGCMVVDAYNYNQEATVDDNSCIEKIFGCTNTTAYNYNSEANIDDGSCIEIVKGCTNKDAMNYNPYANTDDGSCKIDPLSTIDGTKECLLKNRGEWCWPAACDYETTSSDMFLKDGTYKWSTTMLGGLHKTGIWSITRPGEVRVKTTHAAYGLFHNVHYCPTNLDLPDDIIYKFEKTYKLVTGSTALYQ